MKLIDPKTLVTEAARAEWERFKRYGDTVETLFNSHDTVGAIAMDCRGSLQPDIDGRYHSEEGGSRRRLTNL